MLNWNALLNEVQAASMFTRRCGASIFKSCINLPAVERQYYSGWLQKGALLAGGVTGRSETTKRQDRIYASGNSRSLDRSKAFDILLIDVPGGEIAATDLLVNYRAMFIRAVVLVSRQRLPDHRHAERPYSTPVWGPRLPDWRYCLWTEEFNRAAE